MHGDVAGDAGTRAIEQLQSRAEQQAAVAAISLRALAMPEPQELYDAAILLCAKALGAHVVGLVETRPDSSDLQVMSILGMPAVPGVHLPRDRFPVPALTIETAAPVLIDDWRVGEYAQLYSPLIGAVDAISTAQRAARAQRAGARRAGRASPGEAAVRRAGRQLPPLDGQRDRGLRGAARPVRAAAAHRSPRRGRHARVGRRRTR